MKIRLGKDSRRQSQSKTRVAKKKKLWVIYDLIDGMFSTTRGIAFWTNMGRRDFSTEVDWGGSMLDKVGICFLFKIIILVAILINFNKTWNISGRRYMQVEKEGELNIWHNTTMKPWVGKVGYMVDYDWHALTFVVKESICSFQLRGTKQSLGRRIPRFRDMGWHRAVDATGTTVLQ